MPAIQTNLKAWEIPQILQKEGWNKNGIKQTSKQWYFALFYTITAIIYYYYFTVHYCILMYICIIVFIWL